MPMIQRHTYRVDTTTTSGTTYIGTAAINSLESAAVWRIQRVSNIGGVTKTQDVNGVAAENFIWNNRASYTYQ